MKTCTKCGIAKEEIFFAKRGSAYRNTCKLCHNSSKLAWAKRNPEKRAATTHNSYAKSLGKHPDDCRASRRTAEEKRDTSSARGAAWRAKNQATAKARSLAYYAKNRETLIAKVGARAKKNAKKIADYQTEWRRKNGARKAANDKLWRQANPDKVALAGSKRCALVKTCTPPWLTLEHHNLIKCTYLMRDILTELTGVEHHVDHVHPLNGVGFNGLHVPWNMRVMVGTENQSKNARLPEAERHLLWSMR